MALFEPANSMLAPLAKATITVLFDPTMSSHLQAPVKVSVLLLPKMWAPPPAQFKVVVLFGTNREGCPKCQRNCKVMTTI